MLRRKIFGDPKEEIEKQKRMRTETQEIILAGSIERSPYFNVLSNNQHYIDTDTFSEYSSHIQNPINPQSFQSEPLNLNLHLQNACHNEISDYFQQESVTPNILPENIENQMLNQHYIHTFKNQLLTEPGREYSQQNVSHIQNVTNPQYFQLEPLNLNLHLENSCCNEIVNYFQEESDTPNILSGNIDDQMLNLQKQLNCTLNTVDLKTPPVEYIYNPLEYAFNAYETYIRKYCCSTKKLVLVGMNPGPFGMCQTGIPFGDPICAREFLKIEETIINKPLIECPHRPILGFASTRREQSGKRLWSFFKSVCHTPENFFKNAFLLNFCPIALMQENGRNVTPGEIKDSKVRESLENLCADWYLKVIRLLQPEYVIAIGNYIHTKTKKLFKANRIENIKILYMPHPSPRAAKNQDWHEKAQKFLEDNNLTQYFCD